VSQQEQSVNWLM